MKQEKSVFTNTFFKFGLTFFFFVATALAWSYSQAMSLESLALLDQELAESKKELQGLQKEHTKRVKDRLEAEGQIAYDEPITTMPPAPGQIAACENGGCLEVVSVQ